MHKVYNSSKVYHEAFETRQELDNDYADELVVASVAGYSEMQRGENIGAFLMTKRAAAILRQLRMDLDAVGMPFGEAHKKRADLVYDAIIQMTIEAKRDLKTP